MKCTNISINTVATVCGKIFFVFFLLSIRMNHWLSSTFTHFIVHTTAKWRWHEWWDTCTCNQWIGLFPSTQSNLALVSVDDLDQTDMSTFHLAMVSWWVTVVMIIADLQSLHILQWIIEATLSVDLKSTEKKWDRHHCMMSEIDLLTLNHDLWGK